MLVVGPVVPASRLQFFFVVVVVVVGVPFGEGKTENKNQGEPADGQRQGAGGAQEGLGAWKNISGSTGLVGECIHAQENNKTERRVWR